MQALSLQITRYPSGLHQPPHAHDELHLSLVLRGAVAECIGGRTELLGSMSVVSKDPGVVHANAWGNDGAVLARLSITGQGLRDLAHDPRVHKVWTWIHDIAVAAPFLRLVSRARTADSTVSPDDTEASDLVAALAWGRDPRGRGAPPAWLRDAVALVREGWRPGLSVADVARHAGVHPVYLARCMRRWYGTSAGSELRRMRLRQAVRGLADASRSVSRVAHETGFADEPHLCRSLRGASTFTPGRLRAVVRSASALARQVRRR